MSLKYEEVIDGTASVCAWHVGRPFRVAIDKSKAKALPYVRHTGLRYILNYDDQI